ncbi:hypothetical protein Hanom_Chr13g01214291 [Helianthus anomalus]
MKFIRALYLVKKILLSPSRHVGHSSGGKIGPVGFFNSSDFSMSSSVSFVATSSMLVISLQSDPLPSLATVSALLLLVISPTDSLFVCRGGSCLAPEVSRLLLSGLRGGPTLTS